MLKLDLGEPSCCQSGRVNTLTREHAQKVGRRLAYERLLSKSNEHKVIKIVKIRFGRGGDLATVDRGGYCPKIGAKTYTHKSF